MLIRRAVTGCLVALAMAAGALAAQGLQETPPPPDSEPGEFEDRVVARVDGETILASELVRFLALEPAAGEAPPPGPSDGQDDPEALRHDALERLVGERLRFAAIDRLGFTDLPEGDVERALLAFRSRFASAEAYEARLEELGVSRAEVRHLVVRRLLVRVFVEERLDPRELLDPARIRSFYETELVPEMKSRGEAPPPLEESSREVRRLFRQRRVAEEVVRWTEELRGEAKVDLSPPSPSG